MATILDKIVEVKEREVERRKREDPIEALKERIQSLPVPANLSGALMGDGLRLIAETKKASPSKGLLRERTTTRRTWRRHTPTTARRRSRC